MFPFVGPSTVHDMKLSGVSQPANVLGFVGSIMSNAIADGFIPGFSGTTGVTGSTGATGVTGPPGPVAPGSFYGDYLYWNGTGAYIVGSTNISLGKNAGLTTQHDRAVALGQSAGQSIQGTGAVAIGNNAGNLNQGSDAVSIGRLTGQSNQSAMATAVGFRAGNLNQGQAAVAIGNNAGLTNQPPLSVAVGSNAASAGTGSVAVGANSTTSMAGSVALGFGAGSVGTGAIAIGIGAASSGTGSVAIGARASANNGVSIGINAGSFTGTVNSICIGNLAGSTAGAANQIRINAQGSDFPAGTTGANSCFIAPIRVNAFPSILTYDSGATSEVASLPPNGASGAFVLASQSGGAPFWQAQLSANPSTSFLAAPVSLPASSTTSVLNTSYVISSGPATSWNTQVSYAILMSGTGTANTTYAWINSSLGGNFGFSSVSLQPGQEGSIACTALDQNMYASGNSPMYTLYAQSTQAQYALTGSVVVPVLTMPGTYMSVTQLPIGYL